VVLEEVRAAREALAPEVAPVNFSILAQSQESVEKATPVMED
jgi:hypothetical protein